MRSKQLEADGISPPKPMPGMNGSIAVKGLNEADTDSVGTGEAVGSGAVEVGSRLREAGKGVSVAVRRAFPVLQSVGACGEEPQPVLHAGVVVADLGNILKRLVVKVDEELGRPEMTAEAFDGPEDATGFEVEGCSASSLSRVVRLTKTIGRTEPSGCSCSRVAPNSSMLASQ